MLWIPVILLSILLFYYFLIKPQQYWTRKHVKQGVPIPLLGDNFWIFIKQESLFDTIERIYNKFKDQRYVGMYQATVPTLMLRDPDLIKQITVKDFDHFVDHRNFAPESSDKIWVNNLFALKGDQWREMRSTLSPTFTSSKMRSMFVLMEKSAQQYVDFYLNQKQPVLDIELKESFTRVANDVIANCAFGIHVDSLKEPNNEFYLNGKETTSTNGLWKSFKFLLNLFAPKLAKVFKLSVFSENITSFFTKIIHETIKIREEKNIIRPDMIHLLMEARKGRLQYEESNKQDAGFATAEESQVGRKTSGKLLEMTESDMAAQVLIFFFAGFDAISTMMTLTCYELARNPDIQDRLRQEIDSIYEENNHKLSYDVMNKMNYLDMVICETLRKNPPGPAVDRVCTKPYTIQPQRPGEEPIHLIPGDILMIPIAGLHRNEEFFPNPKKFDPERFSEENKINIKPYSYIPFGSGPRNCIGSRFALMECKTLIFHILLQYELVVIDKTPIPIKYNNDQFNPGIDGGCWIGFKRRFNA